MWNWFTTRLNIPILRRVVNVSEIVPLSSWTLISELEAEQAETKKNQMEHCLANQELSASDVQRLHAEMRQLTNMLEDIEKGTQELDQEIWNEERQIAKKQEQVLLVLFVWSHFKYVYFYKEIAWISTSL